MRPLVALGLALGVAACTFAADTGDAAKPGAGVGTPSSAIGGAPAARALPRVAPPYDVTSTSAAIHEWPRIVPGVETRAVTSFDRAGGNDDGFAGTYSQIGPTDANGEHAIFDVGGPGVLRTLWFTSNVDGSSPLGLGIIRFYFDGETRPRIAIDADALFAGTTPPFVAPLVAANDTSTGGFASWVPLAFRGRLRITTASRAGFYQAHYELVPPDWDIASFTPGTHDDALAALFADTGPSTKTLDDVPLDVSRNGDGEIDVVRFEPTGTPTDEQLHAAHLEATFDGASAPQIDVPLGSFFGSGLGAAPVKSIAWTMAPQLFESRMPMPFWRSFRLRVNGLDGKLRIHVSPRRYAPDEAGYLEAIRSEETPTNGAHDFVYADVAGAGKLVATVLSVVPLDAADKQWWEGDLRSRADELRMPGIHGTGHEDDHLGGWSNEFFSGPFTLPMQGAPRSDILDRQGQINASTTMYRLWPGIAFLRAIRHTTEHGTGNSRQASYGATTFLYRQPRTRLLMTDAVDVGIGPLVTSAFEGEDATPLTKSVRQYTPDAPASFTLAIAPNNAGVKLRRLYDQSPAPDFAQEEARVEVEGVALGTVFVTEANATRRWAERDLFVPAQLTRGKSSLAIRIVPATHLSAARFEAWSVTP